MYAQHFGLRKDPFSIAPDPRFLFMTDQHREALAHLLYGVGGGGGFVLLTGEIGAGKTTVCRCFLEQIPEQCDVAYIFNPKLTVAELLRTVCDEFRITLATVAAAPGEMVERSGSVKEHVDALNTFLLTSHALGRSAVLIIDEAQSLSAEVLEQLRLLTNLETNERKLLQIILIGQPELREMLARPGLEQLAQRVVARFHLGPLSSAETVRYVHHRLAVAGLSGEVPFEGQALAALHQLSGGVPRRINLVAGRALLGAYGRRQHRVDRATVERAALEVFGNPKARTPRRSDSSRSGAWLLGAAAGVALLVGGALLWREWRDAHTGAGGRGAAAALAGGPTGQAAAAGASGAGAAAQVDRAGALVAPAGAAQAASGAGAVLAQALNTAWADEAAAWRHLAGLWSVALPDGAEPCQALGTAGLACYRGAGGLASVRQVARPCVLPLRGRDGSPRHAVLVGQTPQGLLLDTAGGRHLVTAAELASVWRGEMATLWRPPAGWGDSAPGAPNAATRAWVQQRLDRAGVDSAAPALRDRIWAFQVAQGLQPDGLAGPLTMMQLERTQADAVPRLLDAGRPAPRPVTAASPTPAAAVAAGS